MTEWMTATEKCNAARENMSIIEEGDWVMLMPDDRSILSYCREGQVVKIISKDILFFYQRMDNPWYTLLLGGSKHNRNKGWPICGWECVKLDGLSALPTKEELEFAQMLHPNITDRAIKEVLIGTFVLKLVRTIKKFFGGWKWISTKK